MPAWIGLGGNRPGSLAAMRRAVCLLSERSVLDPAPVSSLYRTAAWGDTDQPDFLNAVMAIEVPDTPHSLLKHLLDMEQELGRDRSPDAAKRRWGPRIIDLDLLAYDDLTRCSEQLELPHPRMHERAFVLVPLLELMPDFIIPHQGSAQECLQSLPPGDVQSVRLLAAADALSGTVWNSPL